MKSKIIQFNKEKDGKWYVDFPNWPFAHHNLMMVAGADKLCDFLSNDSDCLRVEVVTSSFSDEDLLYDGFAELVRVESSITGGATYFVDGLPGFRRNVWLCPVTLFMLKSYPRYIYVRNLNMRI